MKKAFVGVVHCGKSMGGWFVSLCFFYFTTAIVKGKSCTCTARTYRVINQNWDTSELGHLVLGEYKGYELQTWTDL